MIVKIKTQNHESNTKNLILSINPKTLLVLLAFCEKNIVRYGILAVSMIPGMEQFSKIILPTLYIMLMVLCISKSTTIGLQEICVVIFTVSSIVFSCIIYPVNAEHILDSNNFWNTIFPCLRFFIVGLVMVPDKKTVDLIGKVSCLAIIVETLFVIFYMMPQNLLEADEMSRAYQLLPNVLFAVNYALNSKKILSWICSLIGVMYLFIMGTRGPVMILLSFVVIKLLRVSRKHMLGKVLLTLALVGIGILVLNPGIYVSVLEAIKDIFEQFGFSTRIIDFAIDGEILSYTSGRDDIYEIALEKIAERPLFGYGVYGEWQWLSWNVHNMYLEVLLHYGVIVGVMLLIWLFYTVFRAYFISKNDFARDVILIFICFVLLRGIFGGSYLMFGTFFMIGFCLKEIRRSKATKRKNQG